MKLTIGQKRKWNVSERNFTIIEDKSNNIKDLWEVEYENGEVKTHEELIIICRSTILE